MFPHCSGGMKLTHLFHLAMDKYIKASYCKNSNGNNLIIIQNIPNPDKGPVYYVILFLTFHLYTFMRGEDLMNLRPKNH